MQVNQTQYYHPIDLKLLGSMLQHLDISTPVLREAQAGEWPKIAHTLPHIFNRNSHIYSLYQRGIQTVIYTQCIDNSLVGYEVFKIRIQSKHTLPDGKIVSAKEKLPNDENFGVWAFAYRTLDKAIQKFEELERRVDNEK